MSSAPIEIFGEDRAIDAPRVLFSVHRYVQGPGVLDRLPQYLPLIGCSKPVVLSPSDLPAEIMQRVRQNFSAASVELESLIFSGQCSHEEIDAQVATLKTSTADGLIAIGGGKVIDAAKCIAHRIGMKLIVCPTLASTDAPCSAAAVVYTADGVFKDVEFFPGNPDMVVVDTAVIAKAPLRFLLAGMADALATGYEARTCVNNPAARSMVGGRITIAAATIAKVCSETIYEQVDNAIAAARSGTPNPAFEMIVEANTLLSGTGFESGGLAAAHAVASALTVIPSVEHKFLHGEMVSVGIMAHLHLEGDLEELHRARTLLHRLRLPICLADLDLDFEADREVIAHLEEVACGMPFMANEPFVVTPASLHEAFLALDREGARHLASIDA